LSEFHLGKVRPVHFHDISPIFHVIKAEFAINGSAEIGGGENEIRELELLRAVPHQKAKDDFAETLSPIFNTLFMKMF
jgi:hypothetical protein